MIARMNRAESDLEARLLNAACNRPEARKPLQGGICSTAYVGKELSQLRTMWLEKQAQWG